MNQFIECSKRERELLVKVFKKISPNNRDYNLSPDDGFAVWDGQLYIDNNWTLWECKIRNTHYDELYLEKEKYDSLMEYKIKKGFNAVYYLCQTPNGVFFKRIDNMVISHIHYSVCPVSTMDRNRGTKNKPMVLLNIKDMKKITI